MDELGIFVKETYFVFTTLLAILWINKSIKSRVSFETFACKRSNKQCWSLHTTPFLQFLFPTFSVFLEVVFFHQPTRQPFPPCSECKDFHAALKASA